ncbi:sulfite exporter TauE/SafE family protein [Roseibium salinum]|nr:sulfite exporter TauE/SafE family protein [Roseibium salinum]
MAASVMLPSTAAAAFLFIDGIVAMPLVFRALRQCDWPTVLPAVIGAVLFVHFGAWLLANADVLVLRWSIFAIVTGLLLLLISGWRYENKPTRPISFGVGAVAGVLGGISQVSGPPVVVFWLASAREPAIVRANLIVFFALASIGTFIAYILNGFFSPCRSSIC